MKSFLLLGGVVFFNTLSGQYLEKVYAANSCSEARTNLDVITKRIDEGHQLVNILEDYKGKTEEAASTTGVTSVTVLSEKELDKGIKEFSSSMNFLRVHNGVKGTFEREKKTIEYNYYSAMRDLYNEVRTRKLIYGAVQASEIKAASLNNLIGSYPDKEQKIKNSIETFNKYEIEAMAKVVSLGCELRSNKTIAEDAAREEDAMARLLGGWTDKPTPWGTPGGPCQIIKDEGKLKLINEDKKPSGASVVVDRDGNATVRATDWPVTGKVSKDFKSIKWSNGSEWIR